jgi:hypothetical protein
MAWSDRLRNAAFIFSDNTRIEFLFEDMQSSRENETTAFDFPGVDGSHIQRRNTKSQSFPISVIFSGPDSDLDAQEFERITKQNKEPFIFEHPIKGDFTCQLLGFTRTDNFKTGFNQIIFDCNIRETIPLIYPVRITNNEKLILENNRQTALEIAEDLKINSQTNDIQTINALKDSYKTAISAIQSAFNDVIFEIDSVNNQFLAVDAFLTNAVETIAANIDQLASAINTFLSLPSRAADSFERKIERLENAFDNFTSTFESINMPSFANAKIYGKQLESMNGLSLLNFTTSALSSSEEYATVAEIFEVIDRINEKYESYLIDIDQYVTDTISNDVGETYEPNTDGQQGIQTSIYNTSVFLQEISLKALREFKFTLAADTDLINLTYAIYGSSNPEELENDIDKLIDLNNFAGDELIIVPKGREVIYYL